MFCVPVELSVSSIVSHALLGRYTLTEDVVHGMVDIKISVWW